jgi:hypothetical protein
MGDQDLESGRRHRGPGPVPLISRVAVGSDRVASSEGIGDGLGLRDVGRPGTVRSLHGPEIEPDRSRRCPVVVLLEKCVLFDGCDEPVTILGSQDSTFSEDLTERTGAVDAPRVEGADEGRSIDESLSEREEPQEEAPSHVVLGHGQIPSSWPSLR